MAGAAWTLGGFGLSRVVRLLNHLVLAWLLTPEIFGLMALVKVFMHGLLMFSDVGIQPAIIRSPRGHDPTFLNTAWTMQAIRGMMLWLVSCLLAAPFAWFYSKNNPSASQLVLLLPVAAFGAVFAGLQSTALATLNKELRIARLTILEIACQLVTLGAVIVFALVRPSVWALVFGGLVGSLCQLFGSHILIRSALPRFAWDRDCVRELISFGKWVFLSTMFTFLALNIDKLMLGGVLTLGDLGLYGIAVVFSKVALDVAQRLGSHILFPVYSHYQNDPARMTSVALKSRRVVLSVGGAATICFAIVAPVFFETLWDERYHAAGQIAQWLSLYVWARILLSSMDRIPLALGNSRALFVSTVIQFGGILPAAAGYAYAGLPAFIAGLSTGPIAAHLMLLRCIPGGKRQMFRQSLLYSIVTLAAGCSIVMLTNGLRSQMPYSLWLGFQAGSCLAVLSACGWLNRGLLEGLLRRRRDVVSGSDPVPAP